MEDLRHVATFADVAREYEANLVEFNRRCNGVTDKDELIKITRERIEVVKDLVKKHERLLDFMEGKKIEPQQHFGEAVLLPVGGMGG